MERPAGAPVPVPRIPRQPQECNNANPNAPGSRESLKSISKSIVQRRTQMFEHGNVGNPEESTGENAEKISTTPTPTAAVVAGPMTSTSEETDLIRTEISRRTPEQRSPCSPKKLPRAVPPPSPSPTPGQNCERMSPHASPTHVAKSRRTPSPRLGSPVRSHKNLTKCQPKIILGAAPQPVEIPVKPPRSKKPSVKLKSHDEGQSLPASPNTMLSPSRPESSSVTNKPTPVRRAPDIPFGKPQKPMIPPGAERMEDSGTPKQSKPTPPDKSNVLSQKTPSKIEEGVNMRPQKPPIPEKPEDIYGQKSSPKPALPEKPEEVSVAVLRTPKPTPPEKPEGLSEKSLQQQQEQPEWMKKRNELMKTRSISDPSGEGSAGSSVKEPESSAASNMPKYAVVDKSKKRNRPKSGEGQDKKGRGSFYDNVTSSDMAGDIQVGDADAPPKPPRTFAHDIYLKKKAERREKRRSQSATGKIAYYDEVAVNGEGKKPEVIEPYAMNDGSAKKITPYAKSSEVRGEEGVVIERPDGLYEEIGGSTMRKPAPPPRPKAPQRPPAPVLRGRKDQSPLVKMYRHNSEIPEEGFIKAGQRKISNPSYDRHHSIIPIKTYRDQETGALKRHKSDEYLYADPQAMFSKPPAGGEPLMTDPIYQDPVDLASPRVKSCITPHGVSLDEEGYAIPDTMRHTMGRRQKFRSPSFNIKGVQKWGTLDRSKLARLANHDFRATLVRKKLPSVREKVSRAYSILHKRPPITPEGQHLPPALSPEDDDEDSQVDLEEHKRRMAHVNSRKEKHYATLESAREGPRRRLDRLFDYSLVVGLEKDPETSKYKPCIIYKYPDQLGPETETIAEFCFPDAEQWRPVTQAHTEDFSFVLTSQDGARHYGYCRRLLPPGSQNRLPEVYCIVSALNAQGFYRQLLAEFDRLRKLSPDLPFHLIKAAYAQPFPAPGRESWISCPVTDGKKETVILKRSSDSRLDKDDGKLLFEGNLVSFTALFKHLTVESILKIFGAVLLERRILFTAQHLSTLSSCVTALSILLYPFAWQHTFVPVLPVSMLDVCCAPTPYILGILSTALPKIQELELEEVLIVDLDTNSLIASMGDENAILPKKLQKCLRNALAEESDVTGVARDTVVFEAFLRMFVETTGHYTEFMNTQQDGELVFQKEQFIKAVSSKSIRLFLEWFVETQMFEVFITEKLQEGGNSSGLFETRIDEYREEMEQMTLSFKDNVKQIGRRMITLVSEAGGKLKKALGGERNVYV